MPASVDLPRMRTAAQLHAYSSVSILLQVISEKGDKAGTDYAVGSASTDAKKLVMAKGVDHGNQNQRNPQKHSPGPGARGCPRPDAALAGGNCPGALRH